MPNVALGKICRVDDEELTNRHERSPSTKPCEPIRRFIRLCLAAGMISADEEVVFLDDTCSCWTPVVSVPPEAGTDCSPQAAFQSSGRRELRNRERKYSSEEFFLDAGHQCRFAAMPRVDVLLTAANPPLTASSTSLSCRRR